MAGASAEGTAAPSVVWFRRDLRVRDNPALAAGAAAGAVVPVFVWAPEEEGQFQSGRCSRWWLKQSLEAFAGTLDALGAKLVIRRSAEMLAALLEVCEESGACPHPPASPPRAPPSAPKRRTGLCRAANPKTYHPRGAHKHRGWRGWMRAARRANAFSTAASGAFFSPPPPPPRPPPPPPPPPQCPANALGR